MNHPLRCRCGRLTGEISESRKGNRAVCYCRDCQAYAHALHRADIVLDDKGGTDVVATLPRYVSITGGLDALACLSLTEAGLLRWYAGCCGTPIGNTPPSFRLPYVGLMHTCLGSPESIEASFGPVRMRVFTKSARAPVDAMPMSQVVTLSRFIPALLLTRLDGSYRTTPFFTDDGRPVVQRRVLTRGELDAARAA